MLIVAVETSIVSVPFTMGGPHQHFAGQLWDRLDILLVKVETDDGGVGWGEAFGHAAIPSTKIALDTIVAPLVIGADAGDINALTRRVMHAIHLLGRNGPFVFAFSGIEIALWDLLGKRCGQPIWRLLGGQAPPRLEAYASLLSYGGDLDLVKRNVGDARAQGYRHFKLHEVTVEAVEAAREAAPGCAVMLDVNCAWSPAAARDIASRLGDGKLLWLEEPVWPPEDASGLASLRRFGIPLAAGENTAGLFGFKTLIEAGAIDIAQPSVTKIGGIGEMMRVATLAQAHGIQMIPHCPYFGPGFLASLHIAASMVDPPLIEVLWLEMEATPFAPFTQVEGGSVPVPTGPGLGCDPDPAMLARYGTPPTRTEVPR